MPARMEVDNPNDSSVSESDVSLNDDAGEFLIPPPPLSAFVANEDGSRLIITKIVNENFKSYAETQVLGPFHKYFTGIMGPNGSGKSNVIDSMLFVFGYRASRIRSKKLSALLHESPEYGKKTACTVTVHFACMKDVKDHATQYETVPDSEFYISRTAFKDDSSYYTISGKRAQFKEVSEKLRKFGIDLLHNRFLILQGEVEQISLMKPKGDERNAGMLEYLEDIIGSSRFKEPIDKCSNKCEEMGQVRDQKMTKWRMAANELEQLQAPMEAALHYVRTENAVTILKHKSLQVSIARRESDKAAKQDSLAKVENTMKELKAELNAAKKKQQELETTHRDKLQALERVNLQKEQLRAEFETRKQKDVALQQEVERSINRRNDLNKRKKEEEEKKISLQKVPAKNKELIEDLEAREKELEEERQIAEQKHSEVMANLTKDTAALQKERDSLQTEQADLMRAVDEAKTKYEASNTELTLYTSRQDNEKKKLDELSSRLEEIVSGVESRNSDCENLKKEIEKRGKMIEKDQGEVGKIRQEEKAIEAEWRKQQITVEEARSSMQSNRSRGKVLDALMSAKQSGELPGVFGRMGDLGGIDGKYDVAISTAAGALDHIVVDTVDTAEACIMFLKKHNIGRASFVALDKQEHYRKDYSKPFRAPENVDRLFDLITVADDRIRPAFYYALHDTLVARDLEQASRIAYGATRYRVVTLAGELIEVAGTMSGGGKQVLRGRMGRTAEKTDGVSPKDMERMERNLEEQTRRLTEMRRKIATLEEQIAGNTAELTKAQQNLAKLVGEIKTCTAQEPALRNQIKAQSEKVNQNTLDPAQLAKLQKAVAGYQKELKKVQNAADVVAEKVNKVRLEIEEKTKGRVEAARKKVAEISKALEKARQEKTRLRVAVTTAGRNLGKCEEKIANMKKEIETCEGRVKSNAAEIAKNEEDAKETLKQFKIFDDELNELQSNNKDYQVELKKLTQKETELKSKEIDLKEDLSRARGNYEACVSRIAVEKKQLKTLKLTEEILLEEQPTFPELTPEELEAADIDVINEEIKMTEATLPKTRPNLNAINEYFKSREVYNACQKELDDANDMWNKYNNMLRDMRMRRLNEFKTGFDQISANVHVCYQMLAIGGDAELELVNAIDPFLDGIKFTVRPPKKSWKEIQLLSGGEKTLSSLALIFALHIYKPTPLYFMDEIDSALDWKNTTIVGEYLKKQTKNAQFIVVSLREQMYERSDYLIGICKKRNCTEAHLVNMHDFNAIGDLDR